MKKAVVILVMLVIGNTLAQAQTEKGRWTVGAQVGNLSYSNSGDFYKARTFSASLSPSAGYFVAKNLVIGASVPVSYLDYKLTLAGNSVRSKVNSTSVGLGPFIRYYIGSAKLRPFGNASYTYTGVWQGSTNIDTGQESKSTNDFSSYSVGAGVAYFINNTVSLDASLNYTNGLGDSGFRQTGRVGLNVGFRLFFGK